MYPGSVIPHISSTHIFFITEMRRGTMYDEPANDQSIIRGEKHRLDTLRNTPLPREFQNLSLTKRG